MREMRDVYECDEICSVSNHFFFFTQKTAYAFRLSLVGSEMCISDRVVGASPFNHTTFWRINPPNALMPAADP